MKGHKGLQQQPIGKFGEYRSYTEGLEQMEEKAETHCWVLKYILNKSFIWVRENISITSGAWWTKVERQSVLKSPKMQRTDIWEGVGCHPDSVTKRGAHSGSEGELRTCR